MKPNRSLLFVYNANSGLGNVLLDTAHKVLNPATYSCSLCQLTFGTILEKKKWKSFREQSGIPMRFLHKDEFAREYSKKVDFPAVFLEQEGSLQLSITAEELNGMEDEEALIHRINSIMESQDFRPSNS